MAKSVITTCAPTGGIHTPSMSPHLPVTPAEIATANIEAAEAGALIIHLHARDPVTRIRQIVENLGLTVATPEEARERLALKRGDRVGF